jgi:hypothetical protein
MRTDRYRQVAAQIQAVLRRFAAGGEVSLGNNTCFP